MAKVEHERTMSIPAVTLDCRFMTCERGNIWLSNDDDHHNAWFRLDSTDTGDLWLEVSVRPGNYPGFVVAVRQIGDDDLAAYIRRRFFDTSWSVKKMNLDKVTVTTDVIDGPYYRPFDQRLMTEKGFSADVAWATENEVRVLFGNDAGISQVDRSDGISEIADDTPKDQNGKIKG